MSGDERVWGGVPARNPDFAGREELLAAIHDALTGGDRVAVRALRGMGGVGKTQIAIEYAYRHADDYEIVWWLNAENPALLGEQFAVLGAELGCARPGMALPVMRQALHNELRRRGSWLLIFDNAEDPEDLADWLPGGRGHVLITSRTPAWREVAVPVDVGVLSRPESVALLRDWVRELPEADAGQVAGAVGDLPLALAQAAGFIAETGMPAAEYLSLLGERTPEVLDEGRPASYPLSLAAVTEIGYDLVRDQDPATADLAAICAFLAPEPIPDGWFTAAPRLPAPLGEQAADRLAWRRLLGRLGRTALVRVDAAGLVMHRLTQAILRGYLPPDAAAAARSRAEAVVVAGAPGDPELPADWPAWGRLLPHALILDPAAADNPLLREVALGEAWYLVMRGDPYAAQDLAVRLLGGFRDRLGADDPHTLRAATIVAQTWSLMGRFAQARILDEENLGRKRRIYGEDHPDTLISASNLAVHLRGLGEHGTARALDEETLARRRRVLGEDHPSTLSSASNLAVSLRALGDYRAARALDEETLARRRRVLGEAHPDTLASANNLGVDLRGLGEYRAARALDEDTIARRRELLGDDHPDTLSTATNLAVSLRVLGEYRAARALAEDTLARRRRLSGEDHPATLTAASNLASILSMLDEDQAARELDEETLARRRRVLGDDHPDTLDSASNLASSLRSLGEYQAARELDEDTLARSRRVLGEDHPDTLVCVSALAASLRGLGEFQAARELDEDTLARRRRLLGEDHPSTLISANGLAIDLRYLGEFQAARELDEDTLARRRRLLGEDHPATQRSARNLALDLRALGEDPPG